MEAARHRPKVNMAEIEKVKEIWEDKLDPEGKDWPDRMPRAAHELPSGEMLAEHDVYITFNYEPSLRLRLYQFDPLHHNQNIWSVH